MFLRDGQFQRSAGKALPDKTGNAPRGAEARLNFGEDWAVVDLVQNVAEIKAPYEVADVRKFPHDGVYPELLDAKNNVVHAGGLDLRDANLPHETPTICHDLILDLDRSPSGIAIYLFEGCSASGGNSGGAILHNDWGAGNPHFVGLLSWEPDAKRDEDHKPYRHGLSPVGPLVEGDFYEAIVSDGGPYRTIEARGPLFTKGPQLSGDLKMSAEDMKRINNTVGLLECRDASGWIGRGTATLYGNGTQIVTARRSIIYSPTDQDLPIQGDEKFMKSCWLRKQGKSEMVDVELDMEKKVIISTLVNGTDFLALVKLKQRPADKNGVPLQGLPLDDLGFGRSSDVRVALVSATMWPDKGPEIANPKIEPIVQECRPEILRRAEGVSVGPLKAHRRPSLQSVAPCWTISSRSRRARPRA